MWLLVDYKWKFESLGPLGYLARHKLMIKRLRKCVVSHLKEDKKTRYLCTRRTKGRSASVWIMKHKYLNELVEFSYFYVEITCTSKKKGVLVLNQMTRDQEENLWWLSWIQLYP